MAPRSGSGMAAAVGMVAVCGRRLPAQGDAKRCLEFAMALAEFLFVLSGRVARGIKEATEKKP
jgi:hypothetical protein